MSTPSLASRITRKGFVQVRVGIVGLGFMGMVHYRAYEKIPEARVVAICTRDKTRRRGDWRGIEGNFGPPGEQVDLSGVAAYAAIDELLEDPEVDLVDITLPPSLHAEVATRALRAGKHVFCEKPMAMTPAGCERMTQEAARVDRQLFVGHVLPFFPEYAWALRETRSGKHGALRGGTFKRLISDPEWLRHYWSGSQTGGPLLDLHVHDAHFLRLLFGLPTRLRTSGRTRPDADGVGELPESWSTQFEFAGGARAVARSGVHAQPGRPFQHGFEIHLERATLLFDYAVLGDEGRYLCPPMTLHANGSVEEAALSSGDPMDAFRAEIGEVVDCVREGRTCLELSPEAAADAVGVCRRQAASLASGEDC